MSLSLSPPSPLVSLPASYSPERPELVRQCQKYKPSMTYIWGESAPARRRGPEHHAQAHRGSMDPQILAACCPHPLHLPCTQGPVSAKTEAHPTSVKRTKWGPAWRVAAHSNDKCSVLLLRVPFSLTYTDPFEEPLLVSLPFPKRFRKRITKDVKTRKLFPKLPAVSRQNLWVRHNLKGDKAKKKKKSILEVVAHEMSPQAHRHTPPPCLSAGQHQKVLLERCGRSENEGEQTF